MWNPSIKTSTLILLSGLLALGSAGCSSNTSETSASPSASPSASASASPSASPSASALASPSASPPASASASPSASPPASASASPSASPSANASASPPASPSASPPATASAKLAPVLKPKSPSSKVAASPTATPSPNSEAFDSAMDIAAGANAISKSAVSRDDWKLVASYWQQAINLLKQVPASSSQHATAEKKLSQYQRLLAEAKEKSAPPLKKTTQGDISPQFFSIPIKGRRHGTPIIEVTFNSKRKFEMLFDTGANVTLITQQMAFSLQLKPQGLTKVTVADGADVVVHQTVLKSLEMDGRIKRNMSVVVAPPAMEEGLLGQDFYEGYDIAIKEDIIEFRKR